MGVGRHILFSNQPRIKPPNIPSTINLATSHNRDVGGVRDGDEILVSVRLCFWVMFESIAGDDFPSDLKSDIVQFIESERHRVVGLAGN